MSRFRKISHNICHCQYHTVWVPKYRLRILTDKVGDEVCRCIRTFSEQQRCEVIELNVQLNHAHLLVMVPLKISISKLVGILKGRTAIQMFNKFRHLKYKPYWGNHFWAKGYCVDTVAWMKKKFGNM